MTALDAMKQALVALDSFDPYDDFECLWKQTKDVDVDLAVTNLRAAIDEMERAEPVAWHLIGNQDVFMASEFEPDAEHLDEWEPLFTHPVAPQVDPNFPFGDEVFIKDTKGD